MNQKNESKKEVKMIVSNGKSNDNKIPQYMLERERRRKENKEKKKEDK